MEFLLPIYFQNGHYWSKIGIFELTQGLAFNPISSFNSTLNSWGSDSWGVKGLFSDWSDAVSESKFEVIAIAIPIPMAIAAIIPAITALFN